MSRQRSGRIGRLQAIVLLACLTLQAGLPPVATAKAASPEDAGYAGRPLSEALLDLRALGLKIVFTSELVRPEMVVTSEPVATDPRRILDELLQPHGLMAREGPRETLVVVRMVADAAKEPAAAGPREDAPPVSLVPVFEETLVITPSRVSLLRDEPGTILGLSRDEILALPHLGDDFFRAISLLPGVSANDVSAQFHVRGGRRDETQILLDGQELFEAYHLKDFDSALSFVAASTLESADLSTGGFSAEYGDRMGGILDMKTLKPSGRARGRVAASVLNLQAGGAGGFAEDRGSWLIEARRGTTELVKDLLGDERPEYGDAYAKLEYGLDSRNTLRLNLLYSNDRFRFSEVEEDGSKQTDTVYRTAYIWLTHRVIVGKRLFVDSAVSRTWLEQDRRGDELEEDGDFHVRDERKTEVLGLRQGWNYSAENGHLLKWGFEIREFDTAYDYRRSNDFLAPLAIIRDDFGDSPTLFHERFEEQHRSFYFSDRIRLGEPVRLELGLRYDRHSLTDEAQITPRLNLAWTPNPATAFRVAWGRFHQSQRPYELEVQDGDLRFYPTERSEHRVLGFEKAFRLGAKNHELALRAEAYQRVVRNPRPRYENLYEALNTFPEIEPDRVRLEPDRSIAEGVELFLQGRLGTRLGWWANYAYASTEDEIGGHRVSRKIDQRHTFNLDLDWRIGKLWHLNTAWRYHTGWPATSLSLREELDGTGATVYVPVLGPLYGERLAAYHRLDLRASREFRVRHGKLLFFLDVQNVYDRDNIAGFDVVIDAEEGELELEDEYWAGILPSVGITYEF